MNLTNGNLTLHVMPPPGGGLILAYILNILDGKYILNILDGKYDNHLASG